MPPASIDVQQRLRNRTMTLELQAGEAKPKTAVLGA
jgi:hypothetical protein